MVLEAVVAHAQGDEVAVGGLSLGPRLDVVELAAPGRRPAPGEAAGAVASSDAVREGLAGAVGGRGVGDDLPHLGAAGPEEPDPRVGVDEDRADVLRQELSDPAGLDETGDEP